MAVRRKVFRIEESAYRLARDPASAIAREARPEPASEPQARGLCGRATVEAQAFDRELGRLHEAIAGTQRVIAALGDTSNAGRLGRELTAIVSDAGRSVDAILHAADGIDRAAADLSAIAPSGRARDLADIIRCHVGQILEACGFHDLTGQRVSNVQAALSRFETEVAGLANVWKGIAPCEPVAAVRPADDCRFLNGPKLDGDSGHSSQREIDAAFGRA